jgi:pyruvate dehydrogenase E1 component alpha subunit
MISVVGAARERAVTGGGPTLIEAVTFRMGPHTTADDPKRYQPPEDRAAWTGRDPIVRLRRHLEGRGVWDDERHAAAVAAAESEVDAAWEAAEAATVAPDHIFEHVYAEPTPRMATQRAELRSRLGLDPAAGTGPEG